MSVDVKAETTIGRRLAYSSRVAELEPDRPLESAGASPTWMTLRNHGNPSGLSRVAAPIMERAMRRATARDLARLKALLEAGERAN